MAPITKKTYSRKNNALCGPSNREKENIDPFDELLSSPLKQEVEFKPLSFWSKEIKTTKSVKNNSNKCGLYDSSDPDDLYSPTQKKKQRKWKSTAGKSKKLKVRSTSQMNLRSSCENSNAVKLMSSSSLKNINSSVYDSIHKNSNTLENEKDKFEFDTVQRHLTKTKCKNSSFRNSSANMRNTQSTFDSQNYNLGQVQKFYTETSAVYNTEFEELQKQRVRDMELCGIKHELSNFSSSSSIFKFEKVENGDWFSPDLNFYCNEGNITVEVIPHCDNTFALGEETLMLQKGNRYSDNMEVKNRKFFNQEKSEMLNETSASFDLDTTLRNVSESTVSNSSSGETGGFLNETNFTVIKGNQTEEEEKESKESDSFHLKNVNSLAAMISDMTISNVNTTSTDKLDTTGNHSETFKDAEDFKKLTPPVSRNVTTRRRFNNSDHLKPYTLRNSNMSKPSDKVEKLKMRETFAVTKTLKESEAESELPDTSIYFANEHKNRLSFVSDRYSYFAVPTFESTRIENDDCTVSERFSLKLNESQENRFFKEGVSDSETSIILKDGKKWLRSISVLKQVQSGKIIATDLESTKMKGRKFKSFVQEILEMQNANISPIKTAVPKRNFDSTLMNTTVKNNFNVENSPTKHKFSTSVANLSSTMFNRTSLRHTVKVVQSESSLGTQSAFRSALNLDSDDSLTENTVIAESSVKEKSSLITPKDFILAQCGQDDVLPFEKYFNKRTLKDCKKIGEGVYGEVFMCNSDTVIKIIPIEGSDLVNGEPQKKFDEILSEVVIAMKLSNLREGQKYRTSGFSEMKRCWCVVGKYPKYLLDLWEEYDRSGSGSENDSPSMFKSDQLYIILELANGGKDLESYVFNSSEQSLAVFIQAAFSLAVAEKAFEFEHRDLHWGNLLIAPTNEKFMTVLLDNVEFKIPTKGVKVSIIDFTLSRVSHDGCCIFNDLSVDPELFISQGDYQFEVYRLMQKVLKNDWSMFAPKTNLYWLHYTLDKMIKMVRYKNIKTLVHKKSMKSLKILESRVLDHEDSAEFVLHLEKYVNFISHK